MDILIKSFLWVLHASITASIAALLITLILRLFKKHIGIRLQYALWIIIFIRLVMPIEFQSNLSLLNLVHQKYQSSSDIQDKNVVKNMTYATSNFLREGKNSWNYPVRNQLTSVDESSKKENYKEENIKEGDITTNILTIASCIWLLGVFSIAMLLFIIEHKLKRKILNLEELKDSKLIQLLDECKKKTNINKHIPVYVCDSFKSPCIQGVVKPNIYLPKLMYSTNEYKQLHYVLLHELVHYKRKDLLCNFITVFAAILHWFNPIVWFCIKEMRIQRECVCDACVLEIIGEEQSEEYGMALINFLRLISNNTKVPQLAVFFETKNQIKRRIEMIKNFKKGLYRMSDAAIACCVVASGVVLTNAVNAKNMKADNITTVSSSKDSVKNQGNKFIIDSSVKMYNDLKRAEEIVGFKLKVPDSLPENYRTNPDFRVIKISDKVNALNIGFHQIGGEVGDNKFAVAKVFEFQVSKENMEEVLKKEIEQKNEYRDGKKCEVSKESMNLTGINGFNITIKSTFSENCQETSKFFTWQNEGLWYGIEYREDIQDSKTSNNSMNLSIDDVGKVASSIKYIKDVKNVNYSEKMPGIELSIYDKDDLSKAKELLGFDPKVSLNINKSVNVEGLSVQTLRDSDDENKDNKYKISAYYRYSNTCALRFEQAKNSKDYEDIKKNGYAEVKNDNGEIQHEKTQTLNIDSKEVFKYEYSYEEAKNEPIKSQNYVWKENGFYCKVSIDTYDGKALANSDELVEEFINSKPID